ncbi:SSN3 [Candida theae]|uniref:Cyclin-dependent kinase 8 n=1 Tax=Candida theae TaxID=1198502 RepID=A0AAD5BBY6_9ASCO|nr:SSN3 [Candida theae]KAI5949956.1 SSN3 [Candida theae]
MKRTSANSVQKSSEGQAFRDQPQQRPNQSQHLHSTSHYPQHAVGQTFSQSLTNTLPVNNPFAVPPSHPNSTTNYASHQSTQQLPSVSQPALMAPNSILTLGPFKHRKDLTRDSVLSTYQIIGYIAAGTYGKVYKAKLRTTNVNAKDGQERGNRITGSSLSGDSIRGGGGSGGGSGGGGGGGPGDSDRITQVHEIESKGGSVPLDEKSGREIASPSIQYYAIKKFKSDNHQSSTSKNNAAGNGGKNYNREIAHEAAQYTGISQSAIREMSLCRELNNKNITKLADIILENKSIYMIFEFCEHDLLQIIHYHSHPELKPIPLPTIKSLTWQILNGVTFLHKNWIFHRDLKPANIMVTSNGCVKIGDLGLARKFNNPLQSFYSGDKVVVTIWYRAPELLLGTRHYTPAIDLWAVGCILAELLSLRPIFKGEEAKIDINNKKSVPFQRNQFQKIIEVMGTPNLKNWPSLNKYPEFVSFTQQITQTYSSNLSQWYKMIGGENKQCLELLYGLLKYDPEVRLTADQALVHNFFLELPKVTENAFEGLNLKYPNRKIYMDDNDIGQNGGNMNNNTNNNNNSNAAGFKRNLGLEDGGSKRKRV